MIRRLLSALALALLACISSASNARTPPAGDRDGNGTHTVGLCDPATGTFFLRNKKNLARDVLELNRDGAMRRPPSEYCP